MADIEPPSFSLGLDLDADPEPQILTRVQQSSAIDPALDTSSHAVLFDDDDGKENFGRRVIESVDAVVGLQAIYSNPAPGLDSPRIFKRLRRVPATEQSGLGKRIKEKVFCDFGDDEIEDFSSQEDFVRVTDEPSLREYNSVCSSSKVPLHGCGVLTTQSSSQLKEKKMRTSDAPSSSCLGTGHSGFIFPKLTVSPLRKFQLVDPDTEEPTMNKDVSRKIPGIDLSLKEQQPSACQLEKKFSAENHQSEDLWKYFCPMKSFHIPTPALDEVCEEYFQSLRDKSSSQKLGSHLYKGDSVSYLQDANTSSSFEQCWNFADPVLPAHNYFFHDDPRIQTLVRCRLPHFSPLGMFKNRGNVQPSESIVNCMSQFNGESSKKRATRRNNNEKRSTRGRGRSIKSNAKAHSTEGWVHPKSSTIPKDAGKRRVHANGQAVGRWYTSPEGRKVYVSRGGQDLSGQMAYKYYRKETGGFRKSKKNTNVKRKKG